jgi:hypothetical protein
MTDLMIKMEISRLGDVLDEDVGNSNSELSGGAPSPTACNFGDKRINCSNVIGPTLAFWSDTKNDSRRDRQHFLITTQQHDDGDESNNDLLLDS